MPQGLQDFLKQLAAFWQGLSTPKRMALVLLTAIVLGFSLLFPKLNGPGHLVPLYTNMSAKDAAEVVQKLEAKKTPYELRADGTTVLVPEQLVPALRLEMASAGLPKGGSVGFELFDQSQFGATEFEQNVNLRRALEGELSRSIETVEGVESARVHLVMPRSSVFLSRGEKSSASVVVKLRNPSVFGKKEVAAVVHLVAAAVPGLNRNRISVVSTEGQTLHRPTEEGEEANSDGLGDEQLTVARQLESQALAQLERVVGAGGADVRVAVVLDPSTKDETKETYQPEKTALRSEHTTSEDIRNQSPAVQGIPGARTNMPDADGGQATGATNNQNLDTTQRNSATRNWEVDRAVAKVHTPAGKVARLSVAVLIDGSWEKGAGGKLNFTPRTKEEIEQLTAVIKQAVGYDELRGDTISVQGVRFVHEEAGPDKKLGFTGPWWQHPWAVLGMIGLIAFCLLLVLIIVWRSARQKRLADEAARARMLELEEERNRALLAPEKKDDEAQEDGGEDVQAHLPPGLRGLTDPKKLMTGGPEAVAELRQHALEIAARDPSTTAVVLRAWLDEAKAAAPAEAAE